MLTYHRHPQAMGYPHEELGTSHFSPCALGSHIVPTTQPFAQQKFMLAKHSHEPANIGTETVSLPYKPDSEGKTLS